MSHKYNSYYESLTDDVIGRYVAIKKFIEDDKTTLKIAHREVRYYES